MALRDYLYASHVHDAYTISRINKIENSETSSNEKIRRQRVPTTSRRYRQKGRPQTLGVMLERKIENTILGSGSGIVGENNDDYSSSVAIENIDTCSGALLQGDSSQKKECKNCTNCPKKKPEQESVLSAAKLAVEVGKEEREMDGLMRYDESTTFSTSRFTSEQMETDFTNIY